MVQPRPLVPANRAIDDLARRPVRRGGGFRTELFRSLDDDDRLLNEIRADARRKRLTMPHAPPSPHRQVRPLPVEELPIGVRTDLSVPTFQGALGEWLTCPLVLLRGREPGPRLGVRAAIHGNELNGIEIIHQILREVDPDRPAGTPVCAPVICRRSSWLRTLGGGLLETRFALLDRVEKSQTLAELLDPFGRATESYRAPHDGVVIGMSRSPLAVPGTRYCHLGEVGDVENTEGPCDSGP